MQTLRYMVLGDRFDDRVQGVAWPDSVVRLELFVSSSNKRLTVCSGRLGCRNSPLAVFSTMRWGEERGLAL